MKKPHRRPRKPSIENLEARVLLGWVSSGPIDEVPPPLVPPPIDCGCGGGSGGGGGGGGGQDWIRRTFTANTGSSSSEAPVRHFDGTPVIFTDDLGGVASPFGFSLGHTRTWSGLNNSSLNGNGWTISELPYVVVAGGAAGGDVPGGTPGAGTLPGTADDLRLSVVAGGTSSYSFRIPTSSPYTSFSPFVEAEIKLETTPDPTPALRMTDPQGNVLEFYDVRRDSNDKPIAGSMAADMPSKYGKFKSYTAADGSTTIVANYDSAGMMTSVVVSDATGAVSRILYAYATVTNDLVAAASATPPELLESVTLQRSDGSGGWRSVRRSIYEYYTGRISNGSGGWTNDPNGRLGDLRRVQVDDAVVSGGTTTWETIDFKYYRYYKFTGETFSAGSVGPTNDSYTTAGPAPLQPRKIGTYNPASPNGYDGRVMSGLKTVVEGAAFARLTASVPGYLTASDDDLEPYVNHFFKYERWADHVGADGATWAGSESWNGNNNHHWRTGYRLGSRYRVIEEIAQESGCSTCTGGQGTYKYDYTANYHNVGLGYQSIEYNTWRMKTSEYLPDSTVTWGDNDRRVTYTNEVGQPLLNVLVDVDGPAFAVNSMALQHTDSGEFVFVVFSAPGLDLNVGDRIAVSGVLPAMFNGVFTLVTADLVNDVYTFSLPLPYGHSDPHINQTVAGEIISTKVAKVVGEWATYYRYDSQGRLILQAEPSAVSGYDDGYLDLLNNVGGDYAFLRNAAGLITTYEYFTTTTATATVAGSAAGLLKAWYVQQGESGAPIVQQSWTYYARTSGGATTHQIATDTTYGLDSGSAPDFSDRDPRTTTYAYTWFAGTNRVQSTTIGAPVVTAAQNGPGTADVSTVVYDVHGRPTWVKDQAGFLHYTEYDRITGAVVKTITDVNATRTTTFTGLPSGWTTPAGGGLHLTDSYLVDDLGRTVKWTNPRGDVVWTVYNDARHEVRVYRGWSATTHTTTGPIEVYREYRPTASAPAGERAVYREWLTSSASPTFNATTHAPTGQEAFTSANVQSLRREVTNDGGQAVADLAYHSLAGVTYAAATAYLGAAGNDSSAGAYHDTVYHYDSRGRVGRIVTASGTVYRLVYDALGRVVEEWVGTNDAGATFENPAGSGAPNNMFRRASYQYDAGGVGDGNLTSKTERPNSNAADARTTAYAYDWRNRLVAMKEGAQASEATDVDRPITHLTLNNLGETTSVAIYDGDGVALSTTAPSGSLRRSHVAYAYDAQGRLYRTSQYDVDQATGAVSTAALRTDVWYDRRGLEIKRSHPGGLVAKSSYDGAGRLVRAIQSDGDGDASWADAGTSSSDRLLTRVDYTYDAAGNVILVNDRERFHDVIGQSSLGTTTSGVRARNSYRAFYYDAAGRLTAAVDVGTNGGAAYTRPASAPARSDAVLVTSYAYDAAGRIEVETDPRGIARKTSYDLLGRVVRTIEAYTDGVPTDASNKTVEYVYYGNGDVLSLSVVLPGGGRQTTHYVHGATPSTGSSFHSNETLAYVRHPDKATGAATPAESESYGYNALGDLIRVQDRNGTVRALAYDAVGRQTADAVATLGSGVDGAVRRLETRYDAVGRPVLSTSYSAATAGSIVNQVLRTYNGLGQVTAEYQAHGGAVNTSTTPKVQYAYSLMAGGANHSRLDSVTYPSGAKVVYQYGNPSGVNDDVISDKISRVTRADFLSPADVALTSESYAYLGLDRIVRKSTPASTLSYIQHPGDASAIADAGDQYTGLDRFGRVVDQAWRDGSGAVLDRFQYGYDRGGNRLYKANLVESALSELYEYDALGQLTSFKRGVLSDSNSDGVPDAVASPFRTQAWDLDALGNWDGFATNGVNQARTHNAQNQATGVGGATLTFDANGNMKTDEAGRRFVYDAWNRPVAVRNASNVLVATYAYDALGRRTVEARPGAGTTDHFYHSTDWRVLEERRGGTAAVDLRRHYLWGADYVDALAARLDYAAGSLSAVRYAQQDANWNVTSLVDAASAVVERYAYDPYGVVSVLAADWTSRASSLYDWKHLHQGGRWDADAGLYQFRNREYSPTLGRWNRVDPIGFDAGDASLYRYIGNNPVNATDPQGLLINDNGPESGIIDEYIKKGDGRLGTPQQPRLDPTNPGVPQSTDEAWDAARKGVKQLESDIKNAILQDLVLRGACRASILPVGIIKAGDKIKKIPGPIWKASDLLKDGAKAIGKPGKSKGVRVVDSVDDLDSLFKLFCSEGTPVPPHPTYHGPRVILPDGTLIGRRPGSRSGGPTLDIKPPGSRPIKIHVN